MVFRGQLLEEELERAERELQQAVPRISPRFDMISDVSEACDRLVVLGAGNVLLNDAIDRILADHRTVPADVEAGPEGFVGSFVGPAGDSLNLHRFAATESNDIGRPASLEEVVLAYLSAGRERETEGPSR